MILYYWFIDCSGRGGRQKIVVDIKYYQMHSVLIRESNRLYHTKRNNRKFVQPTKPENLFSPQTKMTVSCFKGQVWNLKHKRWLSGCRDVLLVIRHPWVNMCRVAFFQRQEIEPAKVKKNDFYGGWSFSMTHMATSSTIVSMKGLMVFG